MSDIQQLNRNGNRRGMTPNSQKNLGKGRMGNNHAQKGLSITRIQREMLSQLCPYAKDPTLTWVEYLAERGMAMASENATYYKELLDRLEGKVTQPIAGEGGGPIKTEIIVSSEAAKALTRAILNGKGT